MNSLGNIRYSVLDLATVIEGSPVSDTFKRSVELARAAEKWGFTRYWFAEHHNMISVASSATAVLIGHVAGATRTIRVGSGGIMLPNHSPLIIAEQFGTLDTLYPGRIDLGLGRAPGTDQITAFAIRGQNMYAANNFPEDVQKLQTLFSGENSGAKVRAHPGEGRDVPIWILGSSTDSARVAADMGLPYAFATHFAPGQFLQAIDIYRRNFKPSAVLQKPYVMACINVVAADSDEEAGRLATSVFQMFMGIVTGRRRLLQPPVDSMDGIWTDQEREAVSHMLAYAFIGSRETVAEELSAFVEQTQVDEIMVTAHIYDQAARLKSYQIVSELVASAEATAPVAEPAVV